MILVQNRHQRLSGNKSLLIIGIFALLLSACSGSKVLNLPKDGSTDEPAEELDPIIGKRQDGKTKDNKDGTVKDYTIETSENEVDIDSSVEQEVEIATAEGVETSTMLEDSVLLKDIPVAIDSKDIDKDIYKVCLALPFYANKSDLNKSSWALNYYTGVEMGMEYLDGVSLGKNVDVQVIDSKVDDIDYTLTNAIADYDLIVGPASKSNVNKVASIAKKQQIPFVSIYQTAQSFIDENPYYIQLRSSLKSHCEKLIAEAMHRYGGDNIVLVAPNNSKNIAAFKFIQEYYQLNTADSTAAPLKEIIIDEDPETNVLSEDVFDSVLTEFSTRKVFIVLSWKKENFILETLKLINAKKLLTEVEVLGFPQWINSVDKSIDLFNSLNVRISANYYLDPQNIEVHNFKSNYHAKYGSMPTKEAFEGYATIIYFVQGVSKYGKGIINNLNNLEQPPFLSYSFDKVPLKGMNEDFSKFRLFENKSIKMLSFDNATIKVD